jgi:hypothetical protein
MKTNQSPKSLDNLFKNPSEIMDAVKNPGKYGMDLYKGLSTKNQQYVLFAAGAGLILYGLYLNRKGNTTTH